MLKKPASGVLASLEAQRTEAYAYASSLAAALLNGLFEHPERLFWQRRQMEDFTGVLCIN